MSKAPQLEASTALRVAAEVIVHGPVYLVSVVPAGTPVLLAPGQPAVEVEVVVGLDVVVVDDVVDEVDEVVAGEVVDEVVDDDVVLEVVVGLFHRPRVEVLVTHLRHLYRSAAAWSRLPACAELVAWLRG